MMSIQTSPKAFVFGSKGWKVWVWRRPCLGSTPRSRSSYAWRVIVLDDHLCAEGDAPAGDTHDEDKADVWLYAYDWIAMYGGGLSDIPRKPTLMILSGTARKVTT